MSLPAGGLQVGFVLVFGIPKRDAFYPNAEKFKNNWFLPGQARDADAGILKRYRI
jgi:hypothetical protein